MGALLRYPYVGPRRFEEADKEYFFGRENEARQLLSMVISERLVLFHSQSGAGKSSLINTRLRPGLHNEGFVVLPTARVGGSLPEGITAVNNIFIFNLIASLNPAANTADKLTDTTLHHFLQSRKTAVPATDEYGQEKAWVLIIDQFEEIVTTNLERWKDRQGFFQQLGEALLADPLLWVVLAMREDHIAAIEPYVRYLPWGIRVRFNMQRMTAAAALKAITEPALKEERPFTDSAARLLVDNLRQLRTTDQTVEAPLGEYVEPVQLQVVCYQLWKNLNAQPEPPDVITEKDLQAFGDVDTALAQFYEAALSNILPLISETELALRRWFEEKLITESGTRGTVYQGGQNTEGMSNETVRLLANEYLLRAESRAGGLWYELVHDRFVAPILQANQIWRLRQNPLTQAADQWLRSQRRRDLLYKDEQLNRTLESADWESLEPSVKEFLTASQEAQSQRDLEQAQQMAEEQERRAEAEARTARRLRFLTVALAVAILVALWFAYQASQERDTAENNAALAVEARGTAEANATLAISQQKQAELSQSAADKARATSDASAALAREREAEAIASANLAATRQAELLTSQAEARAYQKISLSRSLALQASDRLAEDNTELAALLALEALPLSEDKSTALLTRIMTWPHFNLGLVGHSYAVTALAFDPTGDMLATADEGGALFLWRFGMSGIRSQLLRRQGSSFQALQFSPDGRMLAAADEAGRLAVWPDITAVSTAAEPTTLGNLGAPVQALAFTPEGTQLGVATSAGVVSVWDVGTAVSQTLSLSPTLPINRLTFAASGEKFAIASGKEVQIWDVNQPAAPLVTWEKEGVVFQSLAFSPDGFLLAAGGSNVDETSGEIDIWAVPGLDEIVTDEPISFSAHKTAVDTLAFDPSGRLLASAGSDGLVYLWDALYLADTFRFGYGPSDIRENDYLLDQFSSRAGSPHVLSFDVNGKKLAIGYSNGQLQVWRLGADDSAVTLRDGASRVWSLAFSPDGQTLASLSADQGIRLWQVEDFLASPAPLPVYLQLPLSEFVDDFNPFAGHSIAYAPDSGLAAVDFTTGVNWWAAPQLADPATQPVPQSLSGHTDEVKSIAFNPDGSLMVAGGQDSALTVWDMSDPANPTLARTITAHAYPVSSLAFSPDGQWLASADRGGGLLLWEAARLLSDEEPTAVLPGHDLWINSLDFSPDGQWLASGSDDSLLKIWDLRDVAATSYELPTVLDKHGGNVNVNALKFSPDGTILASADFNGRIFLWNTADYTQPARQFNTSDGQIWSLAYSPDGHLLAASSDQGAIHLFPLDTEEDIVTAVCRQLARNLTLAEWQTFLYSEGEYRPTCPNIMPDPLYVQSLLSEAGPPEAIQQLQSLTSQNVEQMVLQATTYLVESQTIDLEQAQTLLEALLELYPEDTTLAYPLAVLGTRYLYGADNPVVGDALLQQAEALDPAIMQKLPAKLPESYFTNFDPYSILPLCTSAIFAGSTERANLFCSQALSVPIDDDTLYYIGWYYLQACGDVLAAGQEAWAEKLCQKAFALDPSLGLDYSSLITLRYGIISAMQTPLAAGDYEAALLLGENLAAILPDTLPEWRANRAAIYAAVCQQADTAVNQPAIRTACGQASSRALSWGAVDLNMEICLSIGATSAGETVRANCQAVWETAVSAPDPIRYLLPLCTLQQSTALATLGAAACEQVAQATTQAGELTLDVPVYGTVAPSLGNYWLFSGQAGQSITLRMDKYQSDLDALVAVYGPGGQFIAEDDQSGGDNNALLAELILPDDGLYVIVAQGWSDSFGGYELAVTSP